MYAAKVRNTCIINKLVFVWGVGRGLARFHIAIGFISDASFPFIWSCFCFSIPLCALCIVSVDRHLGYHSFAKLTLPQPIWWNALSSISGIDVDFHLQINLLVGLSKWICQHQILELTTSIRVKLVRSRIRTLCGDTKLDEIPYESPDEKNSNMNE